MPSNFFINGVLVEDMYGTKASSTAAATNIKVNGVDLNQIVLALADGQAGPTSNVESNGADLKTFFGIPLTSLPINGYNLICTGSVTSNLITNTATLTFTANATNWSVSVSSTGTGSTSAFTTNPTGGASSGSVPSGAATVEYAFTESGSTTGGSQSTTNGAATPTALSSSPAISFTETRTGGSTSPASATGNWTFTITFRDSGGSIISTTNCLVQCNADVV